jgi:CheY-like chemotaxis protein
MRILIAEDEPDIAYNYRELLEARNHSVVITSNGQEAIDAYRNAVLEYLDSANISKRLLGNNRPFDVVLLDFRMPKKNGLEAAKEILEINPEQRIIFASAYVKETLIDSVKSLRRVVELLQKPFDRRTLIDTIEDKEAYIGLRDLNANINKIKDLNPSHDEIVALYAVLKKMQKNMI